MDVDGAAQTLPPPHSTFATHCYSLLGTNFECPDRYHLNRPVGQGAYGIVCSALDVRTNERVAIKKIAGIVDNVIDSKRTLREMKLLRHFDHDNVIRIKDVYVPSRDGPNFQDVYTVTELMDTDLHQIISSNQELKGEHCQYFTYQILKALKHIHSANVLHRDLKPSNILLNGNCDLKICDFGLARGDPNDHEALTVYVATRWYRAPEIMLSYRGYTKAVDIWSVGCIIGELLLRRPMFPGRDTVHQLHLVTNVTGTPTPSDLASINSEKGRQFVEQNLMNKPRKSMSELFPNVNEQLLDLLGRMLVFNPSQRITVEQALTHPYLLDLHDEYDEPVCPSVFNFECDHMEKVSKTALRQMIWAEANMYRQRDMEELERQGMR
ncbi:Mitogen-activated protein kinase 3 MPK3 [Chondrus crispus]|uniref:Mitogen-activated protein kinase 3 MPK3 n=1 Tax=Chondrus crispus TaxID=2769 RepID=R7QH80_CHOCR|nr:Mitogen-activated protein kinase 3 MPK3 [Chondrus crispus]CDF36785.1 Mitogen-activated protein kinase 3 MPK3 [Chondrus crispus]|eukprot:XP_005716604.1 Mitogen-activated protein kinase 3 MPK3 [Chondrus crispus]